MSFYIGSLEISYHPEFPNPLEQFDAVFRTPVLPVRRTLEVRMEPVEQIRLPDAPPVTMGYTSVWYQGDREVRTYRADVDKPYILSTHQGDTVTIQYETDGWQRYGRQFRPWFHIHLEQALLNNHALVLHSASIIVNGRAIAFTAPSGTGKTTQTDLWHRYVPDVRDLNGDRTLLQQTADGWLACGFPIYGSMLRCEQAAAPIDAIVILRRGSADRVRELSPIEKMSLLYSEITVPSMHSGTVMQAMDLIEDLISRTTVIMLECTMARSAVDVLRDYLKSKEV